VIASDVQSWHPTSFNCEKNLVLYCRVHSASAQQVTSPWTGVPWTDAGPSSGLQAIGPLSVWRESNNKEEASDITSRQVQGFLAKPATEISYMDVAGKNSQPGPVLSHVMKPS